MVLMRQDSGMTLSWRFGSTITQVRRVVSDWFKGEDECGWERRRVVGGEGVWLGEEGNEVR